MREITVPKIPYSNSWRQKSLAKDCIGGDEIPHLHLSLYHPDAQTALGLCRDQWPQRYCHDAFHVQKAFHSPEVTSKRSTSSYQIQPPPCAWPLSNVSRLNSTLSRIALGELHLFVLVYSTKMWSLVLSHIFFIAEGRKGNLRIMLRQGLKETTTR